MICKRCDAEFSSGRFCPNCGAPAVEAIARDDEATLVAGNEGVDNEPTELDASDEATMMVGGAATDFAKNAPVIAEKDLDATVAAPGLFSAKEKEKKNSDGKKPKSKKKKIISAVAIVLAAVMVIGSIAAGVIAFTPKYKLMLALRNTLLNTKSFEFKIDWSNDYESYDSSNEYQISYEGASLKGAIAFGKTTPETNFYIEADFFDNYEGRWAYTEYYTDEWGNEYPEEEYNYYDDDYCRTIYAVSDNGKAIGGMVNDFNGDSYGTFIEGDIIELVEYAEKDLDEIIRELGGHPSRFRRDFEEYTSVELETAIDWAKTVINKKKIDENVIEDVFNSMVREYFDAIGRIELPEYKNVKKLISDFLMNGLSKEAVNVTDTSIKDGMTQYEISIDCYEVIQNFKAYVEENKELEDFICDFSPYLLEDINGIKKSDMPSYLHDPIKFTVGTKNMRIVCFDLKLDFSENNSTDIYDVEVNFTNINKKIDFNGYFSKVEKVADEWQDNRHYISEIGDFKRFF